jgi:hypothetical protein
MGEIKMTGKLFDNRGNLLVTGWAKQPLVYANLEDLHFHPLKLFQPLPSLIGVSVCGHTVRSGFGPVFHIT